MFPDHCKEVSVRHVNFHLDEENIREYLAGKRAYIRTRFIVMHHDDEWAVTRVEKKEVNGVLQPIEAADILSLPGETSFVDDPTLDVLSASRMGLLRESLGVRCVVVRGRSEHVSFFLEQRPFELTVVDVVPPSPSKLAELVDAALDFHLPSAFVKYSVVERDLNEMLRSPCSDSVMFPCKASGLEHDCSVGYLDETPELTREQIRETTLLGCSLSARIFKAVYGEEPCMMNICPVDLLPSMNISGPVLAKCCKVKEGFELQGDVAVVPWGARAEEVAAALEALMAHMSS
ncbi:MAG: hypothetical protein JSU93_05430 [Methanobacteriota archaeon]|nr:MAG: hypothetical protein JSU93_05430 [Euryarchaeota archaeon]